MNRTSFAPMLDNPSTMLVSVTWLNSPDHDSVEFRVRLDDTDEGGVPYRGRGPVIGIGHVDGRAIVATSRSRGAMVDLISHVVEDAARSAFDYRNLHRMLRRLEFALYAIDNEDGHGFKFAKELGDMWKMDKDAWPQYAARRERIVAWLEKVEP